MKISGMIDLHMHSAVSDGTDTPAELLEIVREKGIGLFSLTDHDAVKGSRIIQEIRKDGDPLFITGAEFSCKDEDGQYHILGYGYDPECEPVRELIHLGHTYRMNKLRARLDFLEERFGITFPQEETDSLFLLDNPGKPHIGNLMVKYGYAQTRDSAIRDYLNKVHFGTEYVRPEEAIRGIIEGGGIPVLAHPSYGNGDQLIVGEKMEWRLKKLMSFGLRGVEAFYSGFTDKLRDEMLGFAGRYRLFVTAGSDYHGSNKLVKIGDTGLESAADIPASLTAFLEMFGLRMQRPE